MTFDGGKVRKPHGLHEHWRKPGEPAAPEPLVYPFSGLNIILLNGFTRETIDGEEFISVDDLDGLWKAVGLHLATKKKELLPEEVRFLRHFMDLTQLELGVFLRVSDQTIARWEKGKAELPGPADVAIRTAVLNSERAAPEGRELANHFLEVMKQLAGAEDQEAAVKLEFEQRDGWHQAA